MQPGCHVYTRVPSDLRMTAWLRDQQEFELSEGSGSLGEQNLIDTPLDAWSVT